jgi:prepilin-type N-terminal cleavage/methylation domain-containing protein
MTDRSNKKGFTLIEVVIVGVLVAVFALGGFSLFMMYTNAKRETAAYLKMQWYADALMDEIARRVRTSSFVLKTETETPPGVQAIDENGGFVTTDTTFVVIEGEDPVPHKRLFVRGDGSFSKIEFTTDGRVRFNDTTFVVGGRDVRIDFDASGFRIREDRKQVRVNFIVKAVSDNGEPMLVSDGTPLTLNIQRGVFRCRNL